MANDIEEDKEALLFQEIEDDSNWYFLFDPREFVWENDELKLENYKLNLLTYRRYAITVCKIRTKIINKSEAIKAEEYISKDEGP